MGSVKMGVASTCVPLNVMYEHFGPAQVAQVCQKLTVEQGLDYFMTCTAVVDEAGNFTKELFLAIKHGDAAAKTALSNMLDGNDLYQLHSKSISVHEGMQLTTWKAGNTKVSRKDLEKVVKAFF